VTVKDSSVGLDSLEEAMSFKIKLYDVHFYECENWVGYMHKQKHGTNGIVKQTVKPF
jgi:hypothetical protein